MSQLNIPNKTFKRMAEWWPSCNLKRKDEEFWKFEFCKHGYIFGQGEYYTITMKAFDFFMGDIDLFQQANEVSVGGEIHIKLLYDMKDKSFERNECPIVNDYASKLKSVYDEIAFRLETMSENIEDSLNTKNKKEYTSLKKKLKSLFKSFDTFNKKISPKKYFKTI